MYCKYGIFQQQYRIFLLFAAAGSARGSMNIILEEISVSDLTFSILCSIVYSLIISEQSVPPGAGYPMSFLCLRQPQIQF